jgi:hypothetical protein
VKLELGRALALLEQVLRSAVSGNAQLLDHDRADTSEILDMLMQDRE